MESYEQPEEQPSNGLTERLQARWAGMGGRLGIGISTIGFVIIAVAWNGAASVDFAQGQIPYILSGGALGVGLIVVGSALMVTESNRRDRREIETRLEALIQAVREGGPVTNGSAPAQAAAATAVDPNLVVSGRTTYHDPECHVVKNRPEASRVPRQVAKDTGLQPCRVCQPA